MLQEVIFILDEVDDKPCTIHDIEKVSLNSFFAEYENLMDSCRLILTQQLYSSNIYDLSQWCLLFPMEYIFEDFLAGFLDLKFSKDWKVEYQKSNEYLCTDPKVFNIQHDIFLTLRSDASRKIIIDTKYKIRDLNFKSDPKKGVAQTDLYQMISYALKRGCTDLILVYPNLSEEINSGDVFEIISGFAGKEKIKIVAIEIPFWSFTDFENLDKKLFEIIESNLNIIMQPVHG
jgi:5-methylcytosine-specific restriction enzyme subunit McrC